MEQVRGSESEGTFPELQMPRLPFYIDSDDVRVQIGRAGVTLWVRGIANMKRDVFYSENQAIDAKRATWTLAKERGNMKAVSVSVPKEDGGVEVPDFAQEIDFFGLSRALTAEFTATGEEAEQ